MYLNLKLIYSEKATKFCEISTLLLTTVHTVKRKLEILQNFLAFSEYINFNYFNSKPWKRRQKHKLLREDQSVFMHENVKYTLIAKNLHTYNLKNEFICFFLIKNYSKERSAKVKNFDFCSQVFPSMYNSIIKL